MTIVETNQKDRLWTGALLTTTMWPGWFDAKMACHYRGITKQIGWRS